MNPKETDDAIVLSFLKPASQSPVAENIGLSETGTHTNWSGHMGIKILVAL